MVTVGMGPPLELSPVAAARSRFLYGTGKLSSEMSISKEVSRQLLGLSQLALSNMETGQLLNAKCSLLRLAAIVQVETDHTDEIEKWRPAGI